MVINRLLNTHRQLVTLLHRQYFSAKTISLQMAALSGANLCRTVQSSAMSKERHSEEAIVEFPNLKVFIIPALADNFMYLVIDTASRKAFAVDPVEPDSILDVVKREGAVLTAALTTHHHWDHAGGNEKLLKLHESDYPNSGKLKIYGGDDRVEGLNHKVGHGDKIYVGSLTIDCFFTPCHTSGHICYFLDTTDDLVLQKPMVFTGDTLFIGGCGRFFEGTAEQMHHALTNVLGTLPAETLVFCGHEYTVANFKFVLSVDKNNAEARMKYSWAEKMRAIKHVTVPSTIGEELRTNIFMRGRERVIQDAINENDPIRAMAKLRSMKNEF